MAPANKPVSLPPAVMVMIKLSPTLRVPEVGEKLTPVTDGELASMEGWLDGGVV